MPGDLVKVTCKKWDWKVLRSMLPEQVTEDVVLNSRPLGRVAEVTHVYDQEIGGLVTRMYLLRFPSEDSLEVTSEFALKNLIKVGRSVFAEENK